MKKSNRTKWNEKQHVFVSVVLLVALIGLFCHVSSGAGELQQAGQTPASRLSTLKPQAAQQPSTPQPSKQQQPPAAQQQPQPPSPQAPAPKEPSPAQRAVEVLRVDVARDSLNPQLRYQLANALHDAGENEASLLEYDKALSLRPDFKEALVNRGALLNELGRISDAIASFEKALALAPRDTKALVNLGNSFYALQQYDNALKQYRLAVAADTAFAEGYYYIGVAFADAGIYREAIREWEKIQQVAPNSEAAKNARDNMDLLKKFMSGKQSETQPQTQ